MIWRSGLRSPQAFAFPANASWLFHGCVCGRQRPGRSIKPEGKMP